MSEETTISLKISPNYLTALEKAKEKTGLNASQIIRRCLLVYCKSLPDADAQTLKILEDKEKQRIIREKGKWLLKKSAYPHSVRKMLNQMKEDRIPMTEEFKKTILEEAKIFDCEEQIKRLLEL